MCDIAMVMKELGKRIKADLPRTYLNLVYRASIDKPSSRRPVVGGKHRSICSAYRGIGRSKLSVGSRWVKYEGICAACSLPIIGQSILKL